MESNENSLKLETIEQPNGVGQLCSFASLGYMDMDLTPQQQDQWDEIARRNSENLDDWFTKKSLG